MITLYGEHVREIASVIDDIREHPERYDYASLGLYFYRDGQLLNLHEGVTDGVYRMSDGRLLADDGTYTHVNEKTIKMRVDLFMQMTEFLAFTTRSYETHGPALRQMREPTLELILTYEERNRKTAYHAHMHFIGFIEDNPQDFFHLATNGSKILVEDRRPRDFCELSPIKRTL